MSLSKFYVYVHRRADDNTIFYVGKGEGRRAWRKTSRSDWWKNVVAKHDYRVEIVIENMSEDDAFQLEKEFVAFFEGYLVNLTKGGDGISGYKLDEKAKRDLSERVTRQWENDEIRKRRIAGLHLDRATNPKYVESKSNAAKTRWSQQNARKDAADVTRQRFSKQVIRGDGVVFSSTKAAADHMGVWQPNISSAAIGKQKTAYGYTWKYI